MKKILALVVAFALCFTAVAGCITTSAEDAAAAPAIEISSVELANTAGATSFTVSGTNCGTIAAQKLTVTIEAGVTFTGIEGLINAADVETGEDADYRVETVDGNTVVTLVSVLNIGATNDAFTYTFNVTVPANETEADVVYDVTAATVAGSVDEEYITVEIAPATITVKALVVEPDVCEHANWTEWNITQPTKTETGLKTRTCLDCGEATEEVIPAAVLDTTMVFRTPNVTIAETLGLRLRARTSVLTDETATYKFVVTPQKYDATTLNEVSGETVEYALDKTSTNYQLDLSGIAITELGLNVNAYIVRYDADGIFVAYSNVEAFNPATTLKGMINESATEGTTAYKYNLLIADLLTLGAEAQDYFPGLINSTTCDLYTSERVNAGVENWASATLGDLNAVDTTTNTVWNPDSAITSTTNRLSMEVSLNPAPAPTFVVRNASATGSNPLDYSKLSMTISYTSENDGQTRTETYEGDEWNDLVVRTHLKAGFPKVAMYDSDQVITAVLTYEGTEVFTSTYTLETYYSANLDNATLGTLAQATAKLGISARNYFNSLG